MKNLRTFLPIVACFALAFFSCFGMIGCASAQTNAAERAFTSYVDATGTEYRSYVTNDPLLSPDQKARRFSSVDAAVGYAADIRRRQAPTALGGVTR